MDKEISNAAMITTRTHTLDTAAMFISEYSTE